MKELSISVMLFCASFSFGQLKLIPTPRYVQEDFGHFWFNDNASIALTNPDSPEDRFAAEQITTEAKDVLHVPLRLVRSTTQPSIVIHNGGEGLAIRGTKMDILWPEKLGLKIPEEVSKEVYQLVITREKVDIYSASPEGRFNAIQTLRQLIRANASKDGIPCC